MIIDVHSHTPQFRDNVPEGMRQSNPAWRPDRAVDSVYTWSEFIQAAEPADRTIVFPIKWHPSEKVGSVNGPDKPGDWQDVNIATAEFVRAFPEKLLGFMSLHPNDLYALEELDRCRTDLGLKGIKLGANYQIFDPLEARSLAIYAEAERQGLPILFHIGTSPVRMAPIRYAHPLVVDEIAQRYPDLKIIMAHMGHPWTADTIVVVRKHPNVYTDISGLFYRPFTQWEALARATEWNILDKVLLASDFPITTIGETIDGLRRVNEIVEGTRLPRVPEERIEDIINRDSLTLLGLA